MTKIEQQLITTLTESINKLSGRVEKLEETINKGKGAYILFISLLSVIGAGAGLYKLFGK